MKISQSTILVVFGISGDLARRKLLPALGHMADKEILPSNFRILGITRQAYVPIDGLLGQTGNQEYIRNHTDLFKMNLAIPLEYERLANYIDTIEENFNSPAQILLYLSVPPSFAYEIIELLGGSGISKRHDVKLLLEKPSGVDLESAKKNIKHTNKYFKLNQIYRVDHYLSKEKAQEILPFRESHVEIESTLNKDFVEHIEVTASEKIGIEGRLAFYEETGALRDLVQSHLLEITTLILMNVADKNMTIPERRSEALKYLKLSSGVPIIRAQYEGYKQEVSNQNSMIETFVSLTLSSTDPRWAGVPIKITTGKALQEKYTEIKIVYKEENKEPLVFLFKDEKAEAHEYVFEHAMSGDHNLFISSDEVLETWRIIDGVQNEWKVKSDDLGVYKKGSTVDDVLKLA